MALHMRTSGSATTTSNCNTDIECLRAFAVIGVLIVHAQGNLFHPGLPFLDRVFAIGQTWCGVDLFFAISGFVIARRLLPELAIASGSLTAQWHTIVAFWIRRAWRLLPSAWLWLALMLLASIVANRSGVFQSVHANVMATLVGVANVANVRYADSFFRYPYGASFVYWSLSLEEQFYIVLPLLAACTRRYFPWLLAALLCVQLFMYRSPLLMSFRTDALGLGVLLAMAAQTTFYAKIEPRVLARVRGSGAVLLALLLWLMSILARLNEKHSDYAVAGMAIVGTVLVWIASYDANYLIRQGWLKRILTWIGTHSYAIYLIHVPTFFLLREGCYRLGIQHPPAWLLTTTAACLIALAAALNFRYVEQPLRRYGRGVADRYMARRKDVTTPASTQAPASVTDDNRAVISA